MSDAIPSVTITPASDYYRVASKFSGPSAPSAAGAIEGTFADLIDTINPLQHLPIISTIYRSITGDTPSPTANAVGGAAYGAIMGGPIGALFSVASAVFGELFGSDDAKSDATAVASTATTNKIS